MYRYVLALCPTAAEIFSSIKKQWTDLRNCHPWGIATSILIGQETIRSCCRAKKTAPESGMTFQKFSMYQWAEY